MRANAVKGFVTLAGAAQVVGGLGLIFAAREAALAFGLDASAELPVGLWGAGLVGFGVGCWTARGSALGGIYGRAVVAGNQVHSLVGALTLVRTLRGGETAWPVVAAAAVYAGLAVFFSFLMFFSTGLDPESSARTKR